MDTVTLISDGLANATVMFFFVLGVWGMLRAFTGRDVDGSYLGALAISEGLLAVYAILSIVLQFMGRDLQRPGIHFLYVAFSLLFVPFVYMVMLRGDTSNRGMWVFGFSTLFMWGIVQRLVSTALI